MLDDLLSDLLISFACHFSIMICNLNFSPYYATSEIFNNLNTNGTFITGLACMKIAIFSLI